MPTEKAAGAQTATVTTEHELTSITDAGNYMLIVDCTNMVLGDRVVLRLKGDSRAAETGSEITIYSTAFTDAQGEEQMKHSPVIPCVASAQVVFTLDQSHGTSRVFDWSVVQVDG